MAAHRHTPRIGLVEEGRSVCRFNIDWTAVEQDYRQGPLSLRELACKHGCSHSAIANRADRLGWTRAGDAGPVAQVVS
jgi:hypothetical protein